MVRRSSILFLALLVAAVLSLAAFACDSGTSPDEGEDGDLTPVEAIDKAEDVANQVEEKAKSTEEEIDKQLDQLP